MAEINRKPWDRMEKESDQDFALFDSYLRMRDVTQVARLHYGEDGHATEGAIVAGRTYCQRLKKDNTWEQRVAAYDRWVGKQRDQVTATIIKKQASLMARKHVAIVNDLEKKYRRVSRLFDRQLDEEERKVRDAGANGIVKDLEPRIGTLNMLASAGKIIAGEIEKIVKANPLEEVVDNTETMEVQGAKDKLMQLIDKRDKKRQIEGDSGEEIAS